MGIDEVQDARDVDEEALSPTTVSGITVAAHTAAGSRSRSFVAY